MFRTSHVASKSCPCKVRNPFLVDRTGTFGSASKKQPAKVDPLFHIAHTVCCLCISFNSHTSRRINMPFFLRFNRFHLIHSKLIGGGGGGSNDRNTGTSDDFCPYFPELTRAQCWAPGFDRKEESKSFQYERVATAHVALHMRWVLLGRAFVKPKTTRSTRRSLPLSHRLHRSHRTTGVQST